MQNFSNEKKKDFGKKKINLVSPCVENSMKYLY